ncbi:MAG: DUF484 family protein [Alphaproteobacteria bacterium]
MATPSDTAALSDDLALSDGQVIAFLRRHPDFLAKHPELLHVLTPPSHVNGDGVIDMQTFIIERLRSEIARLKEQQNALVATSRSSRSSQAQVHGAVISMLGATTFEHLIEVVTVDFLRALHVDVVALCVENRGGTEPCTHTGVHCLKPGTVDAIMGRDRDIVLAAEATADERVFGSGAGLVRSEALVRLRLRRDGPCCLLALGSRQPGKFRDGQATELFAFLARALEHCLRAWLDLPA